MRGLCGAVAAAAALAGCQTAYMEPTPTRWDGSPASQLIATAGPADSVLDLADDRQVLRYESVYQNAFAPRAPGPDRCTAVFVVGKSGRIESSEMQGKSCWRLKSRLHL